MEFGNREPAKNNTESNPILVEADTYEFRKDDKVSVVRGGDGTVENDWILMSAGGEFAVVEKTTQEGKHLQKVIPIKEFKKLQIQEKEGMPYHSKRRNGAMTYGIPEIRELAEKAGIDTTKKGWKDIWEKRGRDATGV
jgi:hypothetical protein